jgi:inosine/xanthosine triphosphatase
MKTVIVASTNPVKIQATRNGFERMYPREHFRVSGISVPSGVADQPMSDEETFRGAMNRAQGAANQMPDADYWVGIEGGLEVLESGELQGFAWIVVVNRERVGKSRTATFILPNEVARLIHEGKELGDADDIVFKRTNSKQANGSVGILTEDVMDRTDYYEHALILALIPFKNPTLSFGGWVLSAKS